MSDFNFNLNDFNDSTAFISKLSEGYNPDGMASLVTSASKEKYSNQTLTSRNLTDIMAGRSTNKKSSSASRCIL
jgi:hypothetical protein